MTCDNNYEYNIFGRQKHIFNLLRYSNCSLFKWSFILTGNINPQHNLKFISLENKFLTLQLPFHKLNLYLCLLTVGLKGDNRHNKVTKYLKVIPYGDQKMALMKCSLYWFQTFFVAAFRVAESEIITEFFTIFIRHLLSTTVSLSTVSKYMIFLAQFIPFPSQSEIFTAAYLGAITADERFTRQKIFSFVTTIVDAFSWTTIWCK